MTSRLPLYVVLVISLAFNVAAILIQFYPSLQIWNPPSVPGADGYRDRIVRDMDGPDAAIVRVVFERHHPEFLARRHDADAAIEAVKLALAAKPFDPEVLQAAMDKARMAKAAQQEVMEATVIDAAKQVSPEGRKLLVPPMPDRRPAPDGRDGPPERGPPERGPPPH